MATGKQFPITFLLGVEGLASQKFSSEMGRMKTSAERMSSVGNKLTVGITAPLVGIGIASARASSEFEDKLTNIGTVIDRNVESLDQIGERILGMRQLPVAIGDLTDSLYDVRSAGIVAADQFEVLEGSAKLGVSGLGTTKESVDIVTSAINAFQLTGEKARKVYNNVFLTTQFGKTTISGLAQGFGSVAATVASTGTELDEYLSAVAALTTTGLPAAEAHTQIKAAISGLTRPTADNAKLFRQLGSKDLPELIKRSGGLVPALKAVADVASANSEIYRKLGAKDYPELVRKSGGYAEALKKLEEAGGKNSATILKSVGSTEALNAVLSLTGPTAETQRKALDAMRSSTGALDDAFALKAATAKARNQQLRNEMEATGIMIGNVLMPALLDIGKGAASAAAGFQSLSETDKQIAVWALAAVAAMGPVLKLASAIAAHPIVAAAIAGGTIGAMAGDALFNDSPEERAAKEAKFNAEVARDDAEFKRKKALKQGPDAAQLERDKAALGLSAGTADPFAIFREPLREPIRNGAATDKSEAKIVVEVKAAAGAEASAKVTGIKGKPRVTLDTGKAMP